MVVGEGCSAIISAALSPQDAQAPECTLVHDPPAPWDQVYTLENVVPAPTTVGQPPRKDPQMEYSKIVPQSEQKYKLNIYDLKQTRTIQKVLCGFIDVVNDLKTQGVKGLKSPLRKLLHDQGALSKIIANRIKVDLGDLMNINQSAFVPGRRISDNILLTQELMRNYHRSRGPPRCAFKVDIQKAYDTMDQGFLKSILIGFGFHPIMVDWIMTCVTPTSYSICINGNFHGWFQGKRGLRQGDPLSPYLFTLVMEVLTLILHCKVQEAEDFQFHHHYEKQRIINLCFADDLFLFTRRNPNYVQVIISALEEFKNVPGLVSSIPKSTVFFCNVPAAFKESILSSTPFAEGTLLVRFPGVPLISSRLLYRDCKILVEKLESRVNDWRNKFLSFAGRLQLIRSVLSSLHIYWASGKAKVTWDSICKPKEEDGLGIRRIEDFNISLMATHIWSILTSRESLWVKWIHSYKLRGRSFWDVPCLGDVDICPLKNMLTNRDIVRAGFSISSSVSSIISNGNWRWPPDWEVRFPVLFHIQVSMIQSDREDVIRWRDRDGVFRPFYMACAWESIRLRADVVPWHSVIWFPHCIPRHAIHLWLVVWSQIRVLIDMNNIDPRIEDVLAFIIPISKSKSVVNIISQIVLAATTYYLWNERNSRLFKKKIALVDQVVQVICHIFRLKLVSFKFKKVSARSRLMLDRWKVPSVCVTHDGSAGFFKEAASLGSIAPIVLLLVSWDACLVSRIFLAGVRQCSPYS
ncbi:putative RNA-directed DNA polymerase, eukaryota, reverse transcriptase zinc-binding domain protein [Tanacetum coccineum]